MYPTITPTTTTTQSDRKAGQEIAPKPYIVMVSVRFIILILVSSFLLSFMFGRAVRVLLQEGPRGALLWPHLESSMRNRPDYHLGYHRKGLPLPQMLEGKEVPHTVYTSKNFDTAASASSSSILVENNPNSASSSSSANFDGSKLKTCTNEEGSCSVGKESDEDITDDEEHLPAGQHLFIDIKDVDGGFLNSEERLTHAMVDVVTKCEATLLSYHCHNHIPVGVSCIGVLLESHISFHTWPNEGVIIIDLFTCGSNPLLPITKSIKEIFGVPRVPMVEGEEIPKPGVVWGHKLRGFRPEMNHGDTEALSSTDLGIDVLGNTKVDLKEELLSVETPYQRVDIYDLIYPKENTLASYKRSKSNDGSYESQNPQFYRPDRHLFLDGVMQSTLYGDPGYHESLVHPGMFAHSDPKRVAIIGGGEGATLREVLKHKTVEKCTMIEIDEMLVNISREYLKEWSDCSDIIGSAEWCIEDPRTDVRYEDALKWFKIRFAKETKGNEDSSDGDDDDDDVDDNDDDCSKDEEVEIDEDDFKLFDVIIMDALDPQNHIPFSENLYQDIAFIEALYSALTDEGIVIMQLGDAPYVGDPSDQVGGNVNRAEIIKNLQKVGFESLHFYEDFHNNFDVPWTFLVAMKDYESRTNWYLNAAEVEVAIHDRIKRTYSGENALRFFDGATMMTLMNPHRGTETVYCRSKPTPDGCVNEAYRYTTSRSNAEISSFEVKTRPVGEETMRGVFAKVDIPRGARVALDESMNVIHAAPTTVDIMNTLLHEVDEAKDLKAASSYLYGYGHVSLSYGMPDINADSSITTFINDACNHAENVGPVSGGMHVGIHSITGKLQREVPFDVVLARHLPHSIASSDIALRDIKAGEEILKKCSTSSGYPKLK